MRAFIYTQLIAVLAAIKGLDARTISSRSEITRQDPETISAIGAQQQQYNEPWRVYGQFDGDGDSQLSNLKFLSEM
ncbi:hypothetical protein TWF694_007223 [Orbilia ellipsospora]|uniref:Uncharacterized protein n=1 Tax=Orbilia ellipsospora TaxID=2528407 RepID=A0AAV9XHI3_9PEZI